MNKLKFCLVIDVEGFSMFNSFHPRWNSFEKLKFKINYFLRKIRYDERGFYKIYNLVLEEKFPISFMLVGSKFKPLSNEDFIDWGYHTLDHKKLTLLNLKELKKQIKNIYKSESFSAPMWFIENVKFPKKIYNLLKKEKYKITLFRGMDSEIMNKQHFCKILPIRQSGGIKIVHTSNTFDGSSKIAKMKEIKKQIKNNLKNPGVYCLQSHDFSHKSMKNLIEIIHFVKILEKQNKLKIVNLRDLL